ncbi:unnamed protein product [Gongylonema pulchrum]|uniref:Sushi domain-containing protein n=1 Tax=Gongylonema pulchrum TaxID=637853 RepID=A0A183CUR2_9BILA|nr:unnamed protein product [Gongylonema pulchrum]
MQNLSTGHNKAAKLTGTEMAQWLLLLLQLVEIINMSAATECQDIAENAGGKPIYLQANYAAKHSPGSIAFMVCNFGYLNSFPLSVVCQTSGKWSDKLGECSLIGDQKRISCKAQDVPSDQAEVSTEYPSGTLAALRCDLGAVPTGAISALCFNGKWSATLGTCKKLYGETATSGPKPVLVTGSGKNESKAEQASEVVSTSGVLSGATQLGVTADSSFGAASLTQIPTVSVLTAVTEPISKATSLVESANRVTEAANSETESIAAAAAAKVDAAVSEAKNIVNAVAATAQSAANEITVFAENAVNELNATAAGTVASQSAEVIKAAADTVSNASVASVTAITEEPKVADEGATLKEIATDMVLAGLSNATEATAAEMTPKGGISEGADVILGALGVAGVNAYSKVTSGSISGLGNEVDRTPALQVTAALSSTAQKSAPTTTSATTR